MNLFSLFWAEKNCRLLVKLGVNAMVKLYISTYDQNIDWINKYIRCKGIEVGAALRTVLRNERLLYDDVLVNISSDNRIWGELTGLFWIWKNETFEENDIVGFAHYNKILKIKERKIEKTVKNGNWIVREPVAINKHSFEEDVVMMKQALAEVDYKYYNTWKELYDDNGASIHGNKNCMCAEMFYAPAEQFYGYCDFLFTVLFKLRNKIGNTERSIYDMRYCAFLGERLLSVYLKCNNIPYETADIKYNEPFYSKTARIVANNVFKDKNSEAYLLVRKRFGGKHDSLYRKK